MKSYNRITLYMVILLALAMVSLPLAFAQGPGGRGGRGGGGDRNSNPMMGGGRRGGDNRGGPGRGGPRISRDEDLTDAQIDRIIQKYSLTHSPEEVQRLNEQRKTQTRDRFRMTLWMNAYGETNTEVITYREYAQMLDWYDKHVSDESTGISELRDTNYDLYKKRLDSLEDKYRDIRNRAIRNRWPDDLISVSIRGRRLENKRNDLIRQYMFASDPNQKSEIFATLKEVIGDLYDVNIEQRKIQLKQMADEITNLQELLKNQLEDLKNWEDPEFRKSQIESRTTGSVRYPFFGGGPGFPGRGRGNFGGGMQSFPSAVPDSNNVSLNTPKP